MTKSYFHNELEELRPFNPSHKSQITWFSFYYLNSVVNLMVNHLPGKCHLLNEPLIQVKCHQINLMKGRMLVMKHTKHK